MEKVGINFVFFASVLPKRHKSFWNDSAGLYLKLIVKNLAEKCCYRRVFVAVVQYLMLVYCLVGCARGDGRMGWQQTVNLPAQARVGSIPALPTMSTYRMRM